MRPIPFFLFVLAVPLIGSAQVPTGNRQTQVPAERQAVKPTGIANPAAELTGIKDLPLVDPGTEQIMWDGKTWSIGNNRILEARFEKYLNEPEEQAADFAAYSRMLEEIIGLVTPNPFKKQPQDWMAQAFAKLQTASQFPADAGISETIMLQTVSAWQAVNNRHAMIQANKAMQEERKRLEWNRGMTMKSNPLSSAPSNSEASKVWAENEKQARDAGVESYNRRLSEIEAALKGNELKDQLSQLKSKLEYQALVVQLFFQRRFGQCIIASRLYGAIYPDGDREIQIGEDAKNLFSKTSGMPPTLQTLEAMSREIIADVDKGVKSSLYLIDQNEINGGAKRLLESFLPGEYMPAIRTLPREVKRKVLAFQRNHLKLISALDVKDYDLATKVLPELTAVALDYDDTKDRAIIETAKAQARLRLAKAEAAALNGDKETMNTELEAAGQIWPRNPALHDTAAKLLAMSGEQGKAILELDALIKQKDDRRIFEQKERFIAAVAYVPDRQAPLEDAIKRVTEIEKSLEKARELEKAGNAAGAWETLNAENSSTTDAKLQTVLARLSGECSEFVNLVHRAEKAERDGNIGSALALLLKAKEIAPATVLPAERLKAIGKQALTTVNPEITSATAR